MEASAAATTAEAAAGARPETGSGARLEAEPEPGTGSGARLEAEPEPETGSGARLEAEPEPGTGSGARLEAEPETGSGARLEAEPGTGSGARLEPEPETGSGARLEAEPETGTGARLEAEPEAEPEAGPAVKLDVLVLLRLREQMKQQLMEYSTAVQAGEGSFPEDIIEEKLINSITRDLEREMEEVKVSFQSKTLVLQRMQVIDALKNKVKQNDEDSRLILETMKDITSLSISILESQQQAHEMEEKLNDIKRKRLILKQAGGNKLLQIHTTTRKQKKELANMEVGEMLQMIRNNLQKEKEVTTLIQNIFQNIIIGSRINWAEDPSLKAIVLQLEKNVSLL